MADEWDTYLKRQQSEGSSTHTVGSNPFASIPLLGALFGSMGGTSSGIRPNKQGLYTPSLGEMPVGPPTPINYGAIRNLLNSGVLRTGQVNPAQPEPPRRTRYVASPPDHTEPSTGAPS